MTSIEQTGWIVAITGGVSTLLTLACTKGVDALLKMRKAKQEESMEDKKYEDGQEALAFQEARAAYDRLLKEVEARVIALETALTNVSAELKETRKEHVACQVEQERLRGEIRVLQVQVDRLKDHDVRTQQQIEQSTKDLQTVQQRIADSGVIDAGAKTSG